MSKPRSFKAPIQETAENKTCSAQPRAFPPPEKRKAIEDFVDIEIDEDFTTPPPRRANWPLRFILAGFGILVSLGIGLATERLITDLFARFEALGWLAMAALSVGLLALLWFIVREVAAIFRLANLDRLRKSATDAIAQNNPKTAARVHQDLGKLYDGRADLARARTELDDDLRHLFDGRDVLLATERRLMSPLDRRAKALTAAAARRVTLVTAVSPRALVDIAFVAYESIKLARAIAALYGARPGYAGAWRLIGSVLSHLAVTGGIALGDNLIEQLLGQGLAAKLSARLGEGVVNGLMTVRIGIAAMQVTRPLPFEATKQPRVTDFAADLAKLGGENKQE